MATTAINLLTQRMTDCLELFKQICKTKRNFYVGVLLCTLFIQEYKLFAHSLNPFLWLFIVLSELAATVFHIYYVVWKNSTLGRDISFAVALVVMLRYC